MPKEFLLKSQRKGVKRFWTPFIQEHLTALQKLEEEKQALLKTVTASVFAKFYEVPLPRGLHRSTTRTGSNWSAALPRSTRSARSPLRPWRAITAGNAYDPSSCPAPPASPYWSCTTRAIRAFSPPTTTAASSPMTFRSADRPVVLPPNFHHSADQDHHGPQHGRQEHPPPASRGKHHPGADRLLRASFLHEALARGPHLHTYRSAVRADTPNEA